MSQGIAQPGQPANGEVELICLCEEHLPVDSRSTAAFSEHAEYLVQRKPGRASRADQFQPLQHPRIEKTPQAPPADRRDQALFLIITERRCRQAGAIRNFCNVQITHPLDLKST